MRTTITLLVAAAALTSCAPKTTTIYSCSGAPTVAATYEGKTAELRFGNGERLQLPMIPSEAGERYSNGEVSWYTSGRDANFIRDSKTTRCDAH